MMGHGANRRLLTRTSRLTGKSRPGKASPGKAASTHAQARIQDGDPLYRLCCAIQGDGDEVSIAIPFTITFKITISIMFVFTLKPRKAIRYDYEKFGSDDFGNP